MGEVPVKVAVRVSELLCTNLYRVEYLPIAQTKRIYLAVKFFFVL